MGALMSQFYSFFGHLLVCLSKGNMFFGKQLFGKMLFGKHQLGNKFFVNMLFGKILNLNHVDSWSGLYGSFLLNGWFSDGSPLFATPNFGYGINIKGTGRFLGNCWKLVWLGWLLFKNPLNRQKNIISFILCMYISYKFHKILIIIQYCFKNSLNWQKIPLYSHIIKVFILVMS